jgi:hypothetical protein
MTKRQLDRLAEKLHRLAYELEHDAIRLRNSRPSYADSVKSLSGRLGNLARDMAAEIT